MATTVEKSQERATFILERARKMKSAKDNYSKNWKKYEGIWKMFKENRTGEDAWRADLPDTWAYATIKTAQAAFVDSKVVPVISRHEDEDQMLSSDLRDLYVDVSEKGLIDNELYYVRLDSFKLGIGFTKTVYVEDKRKVYSIQKFDPETGDIKYKLDEIKDFDDPKTVRLSPYLVLVDEMATADFVNTARDAIEIEVLSWDDAKRVYGHLVKNWDANIKKHSALSGLTSDIQSTNVSVTSENLTRDVVANEMRFFAPLELSDDHVEILHYYSKNMGVDGTDTQEMLINTYPAVVDSTKKPAPLPYVHKQIPITPFPFSPYSGDEFWPAGLIEIGLSEAEAIKKFREMMADRQKLSLFSPAFSDVNDEIDQKILKLKPLSLIRTRGGVPKQWQIQGITTADLSLQDRFEQSYKRSVGIDERVLGVGGEGTPLTATEVSLLREAALRRLREFAFLYKNAILREVKLKNALFKQYYASPIKRESRVKNDGAVKQLKVLAKQFKVKIGENVYTQKTIHEGMFHDNVNIDIDMRILMPMTQAEMITKWAQILRDSVPFVQQGLLDLSIEKVFEKYLDAMEVNIDTLRNDVNSESIEMAEGEHRLFADKNSSKQMLELLPDGTPGQFLSATHLVRHMELMQTDDAIEPDELRNLIQHIAKDRENLEKKMREEAVAAAATPMNADMVNQVGGIRPMVAGASKKAAGGSTLQEGAGRGLEVPPDALGKPQAI